MAPRLPIEPRKVILVLLTVSLGLCVGSLVGQVLRYRLGHSHIYGLVPLLNVDGEGNLSAWWSSAILLSAAILTGWIAWIKLRQRGRFRHHWLLLAIIFAVLTFDEAWAVHERYIHSLRALLNPPGLFHGLFYWTWVVPGMAFVAMVGIAYVGFLRALPTRTAKLFLIAAAVYLSGVLGTEMLGGWYFMHEGRNLTYVIITHVEELLEMLGMAIFVYALISHLEIERAELRLGTR